MPTIKYLEGLRPQYILKAGKIAVKTAYKAVIDGSLVAERPDSQSTAIMTEKSTTKRVQIELDFRPGKQNLAQAIDFLKDRLRALEEMQETLFPTEPSVYPDKIREVNIYGPKEAKVGDVVEITATCIGWDRAPVTDPIVPYWQIKPPEIAELLQSLGTKVNVKITGPGAIYVTVRQKFLDSGQTREKSNMLSLRAS